MKSIKKVIKWFELNFSWFLTNGMKQDKNASYLEEKYNKKNN